MREAEYPSHLPPSDPLRPLMPVPLDYDSDTEKVVLGCGPWGVKVEENSPLLS